MKVKMFWVGENYIEEWLSENPGIEIKHILQSSESEATLISVWYEAPKSDNLATISKDRLWGELQDCGVSRPVFEAILELFEAILGCKIES